MYYCSGEGELRAQAEPRIWASIKDSKPSLFTINHQDGMGRQTCEYNV